MPAPAMTRRVWPVPLSMMREFTVRVFWLFMMNNSLIPEAVPPAVRRPLSAVAPMVLSLAPLLRRPPETMLSVLVAAAKVRLMLPGRFKLFSVSAVPMAAVAARRMFCVGLEPAVMVVPV